MKLLAETSDWLCIEKQAAISSCTLLEDVCRSFPGKYFAPIYDLDDGVAGPFLVARNQQATESLRNAYGSNQFLFTFIGLGKSHTLCPACWNCDLSIAWDAAKHRSYPSKDGKKSITQFLVQKRWGDIVWVECRTNYLRKQQIQTHAHFSYVDLLGDTLWCKEPKYLYLEDFKHFVKKSNQKPIFQGLHLYLSLVTWKLNDVSVDVSLPQPKMWARIEKFLQKYANTCNG